MNGEQVQSFPISDHHIFLHYILPALSSCCADAEELVAVAYAANLGSLAEVSPQRSAFSVQR